ncbi:MAG: acyl carrier protein [Deltaproteobacteria bacterium]|nr:acyl carrier protein [Deltaproteobacteria bacterium]
MSRVSAPEVKEFIVSYLSKELESSGRIFESDPPDNFDLLQEGVIDSLGMFNLIVEIEEYFGREIDFEALDPEKVAIIGPLCQYVEKMLN